MPSSRRTYGYVSPPASPEKKHPHNQSLFLRILKQVLRLILFGFLFLWKVCTFLFRSPFIRQRMGALLIGGFVFSIIFGVIIIAWASKDLPDPNKLTDRTIAQSTKIYDRTGEHILYEIFADEKRTLVTLDQIPKDLINGLIATEDASFYEHRGIRPLSIARSFVYGILGKGRIGGGASTLTQQLVKNAILNRERKISRKLKEFILSVRLEQKYTKEQILQIYFNEIPYGSTNYGIESAAQNYFGKTVSELTLAESATLAGIPQSPSYFLTNPEALKTRRNFVLRRMHEEGYITEEQKKAAQEEPLTLNQSLGKIKAPHFVLYVKQQLIDLYGEQLVDTGGLHVVTTLDWETQQQAEAVIEGDIGKKALEEADANNTALLAMNPKNGHIVSMVGSQNFYDETIGGQFNVVTQAKRQPGSSFKPIIYAAAFEKGYTPETVLFDVKTNFSPTGNSYIPENYDLQERGPVTIRQSLQGSLNIPAVKTLYLVGQKQAISFAERLGYTTLGTGDFGLTLVLGGGEVSMMEHITAFGIMANEGKKIEPVSILQVKDAKGDTLYEWKTKKQEQLVDRQVALTLSNVLSDDAARAYIFGSGGSLTLPDRPVAAKTGTTNNYVDAWTVGYTPNLVVGVWAGNSDNSPMTKGFGGSRVAGLIWNAFMKEATKKLPIESFPQPDPVVVDKPVLKGSEGGAITLRIDSTTGKLATSSTPESSIVTRTYLQPHSILHYVQKDDPRGPAPERPEDDPQYSTWETAIQDWITRKKEADPTWDVRFEEPPTEYDDLHSSALLPTLEVVYPLASSTITTREIITDIRVSAPRGVSKVTYKIDDRQVGVMKSHPFNLLYDAKTLSEGNHILHITVEDDIGNKQSTYIPFFFETKAHAAAAVWGAKNQFLTTKDFPRSFSLIITKPTEIERITVSLQSSDNTNILLNEFTAITGNTVSVDIDTALSKGTYTLVAETVSKDQTTSSDQITLTVK